MTQQNNKRVNNIAEIKYVLLLYEEKAFKHE